MRTFTSFLDKKTRENKEHLHILMTILEKAGFQVSDHLDDEKEAYIYIHKPIDVDPIVEDLSFGGLRIYTRGKDILCYRPQNKVATEPFGTTYELDVKGMFKDLVRDTDKDIIGHRIIFYVIKELKEFFIRSAKAERQQDTGSDSSQMGIVVGASVTDFSNMIDTKRG